MSVTPELFSTAEMARRRSALADLAAQADVSALLLYGANRSGSAVPWLTGWPVSREAYVLVVAGEPDVLLVGYYNHLPQARRLAPAAEVRSIGHRPALTVRDLLAERGLAGSPVGFVGPLPYDHHAALAEGRRLVDLSAGYTALRMVKSAEELAALQRAAELTDRAAAAMVAEPVVGASEHELVDRVERGYVPLGGGHHVHYLMLTSMVEPDRCVPSQWPSARRAAAGDLLVAELSAAVAPDYAGQLLRTFAVGAEPTPLVRELHEVAAALVAAVADRLRPGVHPAELVEAARLIEPTPFTTVDDLVHGYGGGYLPPVIGAPKRQLSPVPQAPLAEGMTVVVQPNVVTADHRLGVQTGELMVVTPDGGRSLHHFPPGLATVD